MNVLVYSGSEVVQASLDHTLSSLRSLLLPHYSVQPITPQSLLSQPWQPNCALLVFPGCRDIVLTKSASKINEFVNKGGAFLGLGTGAHYSLKGLNPELSGAAPSSATADMMLRFSDMASGAHIYPSFQPSGSDTSARAVAIETYEGERIDLMYQGGSGELLGAEGEKKPKVRVLARYLESDVPGAAAAASYGVGAGKVVLWAASPEFPLTEEPASSVALALSPSPATLDLAEERRQLVMRRSLVLLGLNLPETGETANRPIAQYLVSHFLKPAIVSAVTRALGGVDLFEDESDHFQLHSFETAQNARAIAVAQSNPSTWQPKHIIVCDGQLPGPEQTPLFDLTLFFSSLSAARKKEELQDDREPWCFGDALLYGEVVTSTQTMLDK
ncbi:unnamed protein product [Mycena citricolor]|uniref:Biotin-protein ligase N-terminal domain-containing protein n=1 Tax=Mycena citricolor TaxID=2018698 RepID=A0AAD2GTQ9_9AGAR|nr:unnamed protein product [Mycena citricolor]